MKEGHNVFAGAFVDRYGERRKDREWLDSAMRGSDAVFLPVWGDKCLASGEPPRLRLLAQGAVAPYVDDERDLVFLGLFRNRPSFAVPIPASAPEPLPGQGEFRDLRFLGAVLPPDEANLAAHARALALWHGTELYCGRCGSKAVTGAAGYTRVCSNADCGREIFPRVDPAIIVLVSEGDRCLLGRQAAWPEGRYSTIAGFVEPGESLEDAVRREVFEETNIRIGSVRYHSSQPWPFPSSLMLGFDADAASTEIRLNDSELEDARWFTRKELASGFPKLPYRISIARRLIDDWMSGG